MVKILFWKKGCWYSISNPLLHCYTKDQTVRLLRPLARRALMTLRPFLVLMRVRKPWTSLRWRFLGWKVLFMVVSSVKTRPRWWGISGPKMGTGLQFNSISHSMAFCQAFFAVFCKLFSDFSVKSFSTFSPFCCGKLFSTRYCGLFGVFPQGCCTILSYVL